MNETYVVDGTNVCWWYNQSHPKELSIQPLLSILVALLENGDDFYCVFDAPTTHVLEEQGKKEESTIIEDLLEKHPKRFFRVTGSTRADGVILHDADHNHRSIITNDIYRDYQDKYSWLSDKHTPRLIQGNLQPSGLITLDKLSYGQLHLTSSVQASMNRIQELIVVNESPASELKKQIAQRQRSLDEISRQSAEQEDKLRTLTAQVDELVKQKDALVRSVADGEDMRADLSRLRRERDQIQEDLQKLHATQDFDVIASQKRDAIRKLSSQVAALETELAEKQKALTRLKEKSQQYLDVLEQKKQAEEVRKLELQDEQSCIANANAALSNFLEPYGTRIPFNGSSWDVAIKRLCIFFDRNRICTHCYHTSSLDRDGDECLECNKGTMAENPKDIWTLVKRCAPRRGVFGALKNIFY